MINCNIRAVLHAPGGSITYQFDNAKLPFVCVGLKIPLTEGYLRIGDVFCNPNNETALLVTELRYNGLTDMKKTAKMLRDIGFELLEQA